MAWDQRFLRPKRRGAFTPASLPNLVAWGDEDKIDKVFSDTGVQAVVTDPVLQLVCRYPLDGSVTFDEATLNERPLLGADVDGRFAGFDGSNDMLVSASPVFNLTAGFTVACWVRFQTIADRPIFHRWSAGGVGYTLERLSGFICCVGSNGSPQVSGGVALDDAEKWYHVAGTFNGTVIRSWVDGVSGLPVAAAIGDSGTGLHVASRSDGVAAFANIDVAHIVAYSRALSTDEMALLAAYGKPGA
jgi:hypothetical protein